MRFHLKKFDYIKNRFFSTNNVLRSSRQKYYPSSGKETQLSDGIDRERDVIIIGGGHNGLITAAYLAKQGLDVLVLERRHILGGASVTEEIVPGFKFSRGAYLAGLLRPQIIKDLDLEDKFKFLPRNPSSFTPTKVDDPLYGGKYLMLGSDESMTWNSIAQFSKQDADAYFEYENFLGQIRDIVQPLLDAAPPNPFASNLSLSERFSQLKHSAKVVKVGYRNRNVVIPFYELLTSPAIHILNRYFESEIVKTTLACDAVIGAMCAPSTPGSAYVLLHHVMGEAAGKQGVWAYVEGGMGAISDAIAETARDFGAELVTDANVQSITFSKSKATGVIIDDGSGTHLRSKVVVSGTTPYHTFLELLPGKENPLPSDFQRHIRNADYSCGAFKLNLAVDKLPQFECCPPGSAYDGTDEKGGTVAGPQHRGTIHLENRMKELEDAYREAAAGVPATKPCIEVTIPSSLDSTISPNGQHVVQLFVQYAPYHVDPKVGSWDGDLREEFAKRCIDVVEEFCPGFNESIIGTDILSPLDLEKTFGLHKGNIFHGSLCLHQLGYARPHYAYSDHRTPMKGLYLAGAGCHPGGGVMGAPGKHCATTILNDFSKFQN